MDLLRATRVVSLSAGLVLLFLAQVSHGAVIHVPAEQATIQAAIDAASKGDEIIVSPGTYYENIKFNGKNIILRSTDPMDASLVNTTIIDGRTSGSVVTFSGLEDERCVLSGFTIANGMAHYGGGIFGGGASATIQSNIITRNSVWSMAQSEGGGVFGCHGIIQCNIISWNTTGGLYYGRGGGLAGCLGIIQNNVIAYNTATHAGDPGLAEGGGLYRCNGLIRNNTIYGNEVWLGWGSGLIYCEGVIINCIIWDNNIGECGTTSYCCYQYGILGGIGNISDDPQFADPSNSDFHLRPTSPCIDAGGYVAGLNSDFEGNRRPTKGVEEVRGDGSGFDIGADEFVRTFPGCHAWMLY